MESLLCFTETNRSRAQSPSCLVAGLYVAVFHFDRHLARLAPSRYARNGRRSEDALSMVPHDVVGQPCRLYGRNVAWFSFALSSRWQAGFRPRLEFVLSRSTFSRRRHVHFYLVGLEQWHWRLC